MITPVIDARKPPGVGAAPASPCAAIHASGNARACGLVTFIGAEPVPPPPRPRAAATVSAGTASGYSQITPVFVDGFDN
jgi:hypothetical protein